MTQNQPVEGSDNKTLVAKPAGLCANPGKYPELFSELHRWVMCVYTHTLNIYTHTDIHTYTKTHRHNIKTHTTENTHKCKPNKPPNSQGEQLLEC